LSATKLKLKKGEDRQDYLARLALAASKDLSEKAWEGLSEDAQEWVNAAVSADNDKKEIEDFPEPEADTATSSKSTRGKGASKSAGKASAKEDDKSAGKNASKGAAKSSAAAVKKPTGSLATIKAFLIEDPNMSVDDLEAAMRKKDFETSRVVISTARADFRHSLRCLQEAGHCKGIKI
jgi:hypothetical protein